MANFVKNNADDPRGGTQKLGEHNIIVSGNKSKEKNIESENTSSGRLANVILNDHDVDLIGDIEVEADVEVDVESVSVRKPHFLDYDGDFTPELEDRFAKALTLIGGGCASTRICDSVADPLIDQTKFFSVNKNYERDSDISDFELVASGYTKKEFTQDDNTLNMASNVNDYSRSAEAANHAQLRKSVFGKPKHFLDENPIPPDYMLERELREHRSLDRNFERQTEQKKCKAIAASNKDTNATTAATSPTNSLRISRKSFSNRGELFYATDHQHFQMSHEGVKTQINSPSMSHLLNSPFGEISPTPPPQPPLPPLIAKGAAWSLEQYDNFTVAEHQLGPKVECVYSLLSMLGSNDPLDISKKFLELSRSSETCVTLRRSGCIPLLVQLMHSADAEESVRKFASMALQNVVHSNPDEKAGRLELKVLRLLDKINDYCNFLKTLLQSGGEAIADDMNRHPLVALSSLMRVSFDEEPRHAMCELGALHTIPNLVHLDHAAHGPRPAVAVTEFNENNNTNDETRINDQVCNSLRRYALMALTNLTFGDENNKAQLCSQKPFMEALVAQLDSAPDDLLQVTASVLRNLSWRADKQMKSVLSEIGTVTALARAAMRNRNENTLKAILSALWNLSAHCSTNKAEFCAVDGALAFLVDMLTFEGPSKTLKIIENAGGILRNVSSHIAVRENYRKILRERNCLSILLQHLKSESLTVVSNSCGTLWNLSARCPEDQKFLWDNGAVPMLRSLIHSKHAMISEGSSSALKNLFNFRPSDHNQQPLDPIARSMGLKKLPTLNARKQRALEQELELKAHAETCENLDTHTTDPQAPTVTATVNELIKQKNDFDGVCRRRLTRSAMLIKSESRDSILSAKSDAKFEHLLRSHSASEAKQDGAVVVGSKDGGGAGGTDSAFNVQRCAMYALKIDDVETTDDDVEQPIDYSVKYQEISNSSSKPNKETNVEPMMNSKNAAREENINRKACMHSPALYQETDLDQPTDFSLRYAESQIETDIELSTGGHKLCAPTMNAIKTETAATTKITKTSTISAANSSNSNEILLILEDTVKCYQTEDTPYIISNAASITDLHAHAAKNDESTEASRVLQVEGEKNHPATSAPDSSKKALNNEGGEINVISSSGNCAFGGSYTPEKPINYCEEGTPGYFSRYESLSSLDEPLANNNRSLAAESVNKNSNTSESQQQQQNKLTFKSQVKLEPTIEVKAESAAAVDPQNRTTALTTVATEPTSTPVTNLNSAQETPLMFSRHSSMDSLIAEDDDDEEILHYDDKSSVVSDFSRLASGVISPSEIPDSPTQSMPQSPRHSNTIKSEQQTSCGAFANEQMQPVQNQQPRLRSVFEDDLNTFHVENTPAQFSCATSLSNLSILEDNINMASGGALEDGFSAESKPFEQTNSKSAHQLDKTNENASNLLPENIVSNECKEELLPTANNDDVLLLANCINMGMHRNAAATATAQIKAGRIKQMQRNTAPTATATTNFDEVVKKYCTEDTPALLSKVGSASNLSVLSNCSSFDNIDTLKNEGQAIQSGKTNGFLTKAGTRRSINLSDDVSSNTSESGALAVSQHSDILQQCIRDGMKKKSVTSPKAKEKVELPMKVLDPTIAMMGPGGGSVLAQYMSSADEMNKYLVEGSPCNFSTMSGLSNLTLGSSLGGPSLQLKDCEKVVPQNEENGQLLSKATLQDSEQIPNTEPSHWNDDSLSSLSIESEDDTNLLSQAIVAGCNRPKSNLEFSTSPITMATSSISAFGNKRLNALSTSQPIPIHIGDDMRQQYNKRQATSSGATTNPGNESFSSVDSCDSNDNQSKSLLQLCILTGKNKRRGGGMDATNNRYHNHHQLNSNTNKESTTQSNPNLKQFDSLPTQLRGGPAQFSIRTPLHSNRHLRSREISDEKLLLECINTGISRKVIGSSSSSSGCGAGAHGTKHLKGDDGRAFDNWHIRNRLHGLVGSECAMENCVQQPKNVLATSAAALGVEVMALASNSADSAATHVAATDVEQQKSNGNINNINNNNSSSNHNNQSMIGSAMQDIDTNTGTTGAAATPAIIAKIFQEDAASVVNVLHQSPGTQCSNNHRTTVTGFNHSNSLDNTHNSDDSNESFIFETTIPLVVPLQIRANSLNEHIATTTTPPTVVDKHKDPELMLRSVERLTLEFVSSAEQLRLVDTVTNVGSVENTILAKCSLGDVEGEGTSNNTWNEDTHPNDVSFPSVSITAPFLASSINCETDESNDKPNNDLIEEQTTATDHKEFHDFAEITPTNEEQPQLLVFEVIDDEIELCNVASGGTPQCQSLETETDHTLVNDAYERVIDDAQTELGGSGNAGQVTISFQVGGAVQTAAMQAYRGPQSSFTNVSSMTHSTLIANEARQLAENLLMRQGDDTSQLLHTDEFTLSVNSLDLDKIRPPSGMETLNNSGYFGSTESRNQNQALHHQQFHSLPKNAQMSPHQSCSQKSPKFPRKALPANLIARRALGQQTGSAESVNSSFILLDNVKPPSLMDELLDSMISVASIQSEIADGCESMATTISASNYETATADNVVALEHQGTSPIHEFDDNTVTLHSCCELTYQYSDEDFVVDEEQHNSYDGETHMNDDLGLSAALLTDENFSSAESTPQKSLLASPNHRRSLTPKMKRNLAKDRYKTYTITTVMNNNAATNDDQINNKQCETLQTETPQSEALSLEPSPCVVFNGGATAGSINQRRTRQERYRTQAIELHNTANGKKIASGMSTIDAKTKQISLTRPLHIDEVDIDIVAKNSATEFCHDANTTQERATTTPAVNTPNKIPDFTEQRKVPEKNVEIKAIRGCKKPAYVSPYSMQYQRSNKIPQNPNYGVARSALRNPGVNTKTNATQKKCAAPTQPPAPSSSSVPRLERQSTFVKEEPTLARTDIPVVEPNVSQTAGGSPSRAAATSKLPKTRAKTLSSLTKHSIVNKSNVVTHKHTKAEANSTHPPPLRSNSNTNMRTSAAIKMARVSTTTPPSRSNSNLNTNNDGRNIANKINQAQSRIASVWKRVNDAKSNKTTKPVTATAATIKNYKLTTATTKSSS